MPYWARHRVHFIKISRKLDSFDEDIKDLTFY